MDNVDCNGRESSLTQCRFLRENNCQHHEDAGVKCAIGGNSIYLYCGGITSAEP